jgi:hypothetical protein
VSELDRDDGEYRDGEPPARMPGRDTAEAGEFVIGIRRKWLGGQSARVWEYGSQPDHVLTERAAPRLETALAQGKQR